MVIFLQKKNYFTTWLLYISVDEYIMYVKL